MSKRVPITGPGFDYNFFEPEIPSPRRGNLLSLFRDHAGPIALATLGVLVAGGLGAGIYGAQKGAQLNAADMAKIREQRGCYPWQQRRCNSQR